MTIVLKTKFITGNKKPYVEIPCECGEVYIRVWKGTAKYRCDKCRKEVYIKPIQTRFKTGRSY